VEVVTPGAEGPVDGVFWLPALDVENPVSALDQAQWRAGLDVRVKRLAALMRDLPDSAFLITGTRLGGRHGYDSAGATSTMGGAVTGFAKALKRERPDTLIKAIDFEPSRKTAEPAEQLLDEALRDPGAMRRAASSPRSSATSPTRPVAARSTCSMSPRPLRPTTPTSCAWPRTVTGSSWSWSSGCARRAASRRRSSSSASWPGSSGPQRRPTRSRGSSGPAARLTGTPLT
jgi:hypothetical protein